MRGSGPFPRMEYLGPPSEFLGVFGDQLAVSRAIGHRKVPLCKFCGADESVIAFCMCLIRSQTQRRSEIDAASVDGN